MIWLLFGLLALGVALLALRAFAQADPRRLALQLRVTGGVLALVVAAILALVGRFGLAFPIGMGGLWLLGWLPGVPASFQRRTQRSTGQTSRVRSAFVEMELDHDTGAMRGRILVGPYEGRDLDDLDVATILSLVGGVDPESRALVEAYLDRRVPGWRDDVKPDADARPGERPPNGGPMTEDEAYQVLGLEPGAGEDEIRQAHRTLMKKLHPDQGGSTYLAARVNLAKDVLLRRHR